MVLYNINHADYCQINARVVYELVRGDWLSLEKLSIGKNKLLSIDAISFCLR